MRPARLLAFAGWALVALVSLPPTFSSEARAAAPSGKTQRHTGAFSVALPAGPARAALAAAFEPTSSMLTLTLPSDPSVPPSSVQLPKLDRAVARSELVPLAGGEQALVLHFGEAKPYVVVLFGPPEAAFGAAQPSVAERSAEVASAVVLKGSLAGADGTTASLSVTDGPDGKRLMLSETAAEGGLCGHPERKTRALDPARGRFVRVAVPVLGAEERKAAKKLTVRARRTEPRAAERELYLGPLPSPFETSPVEGQPLLDGRFDRSASPYEAATLTLPAGATALGVRVHEAPSADASWDLWLISDRVVFEVDTSGQRGAPGFIIDLPPELTKGCVALTVGAHSPFVEVTGLEAAQSLPAAEAAGALAGDAGDVALRELALLRPSVVPTLAKSFESLQPAARARVETLARLAAPREAEPFWVRQILDGTEGERTRGRLHLDGEKDGGRGALGRALRSAEPKDELPLAHALAELSPAAALRPIAARLGQRSAARRLELRRVLAEVEANAEFVQELERLLADETIPRRQLVEVLRALAPLAPALAPPTRKRVLALLSSASFEEAFVLAVVALELAGKEPAAEQILLDWCGGVLDASPLELAALRTEILSAARDRERSLPRLSKRATQLLSDPFVRVRASAASYLAVAPDGAASSALQERLRRDDWPVVREEMLGALSSLRVDPAHGKEVDSAMIRALAKDPAPSVRSRAARALDELPRPDTLSALRRSLGRDESAAVRAEAARALGLLCDAGSLAALTSAARGLTKGARDEADVRLSLNAVTALARLDPPDLDARIAPLTAKSVPGPLRARVESAAESGRGGCASSGNQ